MTTATVIDFKNLFIQTLTPYVGKNLERYEANDIFVSIKKLSPNLDAVKRIIIDNDEEYKVHYFFAKRLYWNGVTVYQTHSNNFSRDGAGDTIIIRDMEKMKVLEIGKKVKSPYHKYMVTILGIENKDRGINQLVKFKNSNGATFSAYKHSLLGLSQ